MHSERFTPCCLLLTKSPSVVLLSIKLQSNNLCGCFSFHFSNEWDTNWLLNLEVFSDFARALYLVSNVFIVYISPYSSVDVRVFVLAPNSHHSNCQFVTERINFGSDNAIVLNGGVIIQSSVWQCIEKGWHFVRASNAPSRKILFAIIKVHWQATFTLSQCCSEQNNTHRYHR